MTSEMHLQENELRTLDSLIGQRLNAYGTSQPGVHLGFAVEEVFLEFENDTIGIREEFVSTSVCGEVSDYLTLRIEPGYPQRKKADKEGGVYSSFMGECLLGTKVHRARLTRSRGAHIDFFDHDALLEFVFESGSLWFLKDELSTPFIFFFTSISGESPSLPDPADTWRSLENDHWHGEWLLQ